MSWFSCGCEVTMNASANVRHHKIGSSNVIENIFVLFYSCSHFVSRISFAWKPIMLYAFHWRASKIIWNKMCFFLLYICCSLIQLQQQNATNFVLNEWSIRCKSRQFTEKKDAKTPNRIKSRKQKLQAIIYSVNMKKNTPRNIHWFIGTILFLLIFLLFWFDATLFTSFQNSFHFIFHLNWIHLKRPAYKCIPRTLFST